MNEQHAEPGDLYWSVIKPIWGLISIYDGPSVFLNQFRKVRPELGHLFAVHWCQAEVNNGGLHQFFINPTAVLAPEAVEGFRALNLNDCATVVEEASAFFGKPYPREQLRRVELLDRVPGKTRAERDPFIKLDERFYSMLNYEERRFLRAADEYAQRAASTTCAIPQLPFL